MKRLWPAVSFLLLAVLLLAGGRPADRRAELAAAILPLSAPQVRFVKFRTADGLSLSGRIFGEGRIGIILAHMYPADQKSWSEMARALGHLGYEVLTFDFRGYGLSDGAKDIPKANQDLLAALDYMRQKKMKKIFLVGASMGGTAALNVAAKNRVAGVATLSSPAEFLGLSAGEIKSIKAPTLFMAAAGDPAGPKTARTLYAKAGEPKEIQVLPGAGHGTNMLRAGDGEAQRQLVDWLQRYD